MILQRHASKYYNDMKPSDPNIYIVPHDTVSTRVVVLTNSMFPCSIPGGVIKNLFEDKTNYNVMIMKNYNVMTMKNYNVMTLEITTL